MTRLWATIFDTETTGLIENHTLKLELQPEVIEFGSVTVDWGDLDSVTEEYSTLCRRQREWRSEPSKRYIPDELLADAPTFEQVADRIKAILECSDVVVGHNLSFDMEVIDIQYERLGRKVMWPTLRVCTVEQTMNVLGHRIKLEDLHEQLTGVKHTDAHRAMSDVRATLACLREMRRRAWI